MQINKPLYDFICLFNSLDEIDKGITIGVMTDLLRSEKYNKADIITLNFDEDKK